MLKSIRLPLLALAMTATTVQPVVAQAAGGDIVVNMRDVDIATVADQVSRITGRTLILDPAVKGNVTVTSAQPLSSAGVWDLFLSVLRANGFAAVKAGRAWRVVPAANAVRDGGAPSRSSDGQSLITRMIRLSNVPAADAARIVRPLVASFGSVEPLERPNAIVVTDYADNVRRIEALAKSLDGGGGSTFAAVVLRNGDANEVAKALQGVLGDATGAGATRVAADGRSNTVIVRGTPAAVAEARKMIAVMDTPGGATPITRVFRLNYADAETVTDVLRGVLGIQSGSSNTVARSLQSGDSTKSPTAQINDLVKRNAQASALTGGGDAGGSGGLGGGAAGGGAPGGFSTPDLTVQPAPEINAVVVRGSASAIASIEPVITQLDVRRPQVLIEAVIAEISGDDAEQLAVQIGTSGAVLDQVKGVGTSFTQGGVSLSQILGVLGVPAGSLLGNGLTANTTIGDNFSLLVQALGTSTKSNLLSTPQITVLDNSPAEIVVGQEVPFLTGSILTGSSSVNPYTTIERKDVGITLKVLPRINAGDTIRLEVSQEASSIAPDLSSAASDLITNRRLINTTVLADDGETIVLGGLITDDRVSAAQKVPILGDIPLLGNLFKAQRHSQGKRTLFIFLKPTILRDSADAAAATQQRYAKLRDDEAKLNKTRSLLIDRPPPRLTLEIDGIY